MRKNAYNGNGKNKRNGKNRINSLPTSLTPAQIAVIVGILTNALDVNSVLVNKDQQVQILLEGSLRKKGKASQLATGLVDNISVSDLIEIFQ